MDDQTLASTVSVPDADRLNTAFAKNVASSMYGYFVEAGYNLLERSKKQNKQRQLIVFSRYEGLDQMASVPDNGIRDEAISFAIPDHRVDLSADRWGSHQIRLEARHLRRAGTYLEF